ncbi:hypothetical protein EZJ43_00290 [Pedobacter changchengzhani]|uniref:Uncharacterized protein n=1 Tax=Pedobacter changchengzhani TaxID=2529274 RepID=A0A4R5MQN2_9SPHI|nr:DUF6358 family protein [Pedobacter changchengzhani]TDG37569.1 hypothetical protein EZJ43_00290 [Pedobacter changchengzhani]
MAKKFILNIFYSLGIMLCFFGVIWCYKNGKYLQGAFLVGAGGALLYFKILLMRDIKKDFKEKDRP